MLSALVGEALAKSEAGGAAAVAKGVVKTEPAPAQSR
jgi:hypothetical protein